MKSLSNIQKRYKQRRSRRIYSVHNRFFPFVFHCWRENKQLLFKQFKQYLYKIFSYIYHFLDCKGNFPKYGDEDDGKCFILDFDEKFNNFRSLLTSGAIIFNDPLLKSKSNGFDIKNHFLFGESRKKIYESIPDNRYILKVQNFSEMRATYFQKKENGKKYICILMQLRLGIFQ